MKFNSFYIIIYQCIFGSNSLFKSLSEHTIEKKKYYSLFDDKIKNLNVETISLLTLFIEYNTIFSLSKYRDPKFLFIEKVLNNMFFSDEHKKKIVQLFSKVQKAYRSFNRLAYLWKFKRAPLSIETDLYLNNINKDKANVFILYQNNTKFYFTIPDLVKVINIALYHKWEGEFELISSRPLNPYNKIPLSVTNLFNFYFYIHLNTSIIMPSILHLWFLEHFSLSSFCTRHESLLRRHCIHNYVFTNNSQSMFNDILQMLEKYNHLFRWNIHASFPKELLVEIMRPYLYLHYLVEFGDLGNEEYSFYSTKLKIQLLRFYKFNPAFGRRIIKIRKDFVILGKKREITFNKNAIPFSLRI